MKINKERVQALITAIEEDGDNRPKFRMTDWYSLAENDFSRSAKVWFAENHIADLKESGDSHADCGTHACLAGQAVVLAIERGDEIIGSYIVDAADHWLGLESLTGSLLHRDLSYELFQQWNNSRSVSEASRKLKVLLSDRSPLDMLNELRSINSGAQEGI